MYNQYYAMEDLQIFKKYSKYTNGWKVLITLLKYYIVVEIVFVLVILKYVYFKIPLHISSFFNFVQIYFSNN